MNTSVILIAYFADVWLPACIDSLVKASSQRLHLVLIDNAGNSVIDHLNLSNYDTEILKTPRPMGFAEANNFGLTNASHLEESVLFLNQDTISQPGWIDKCLNCFREDDKLGAVSPFIHTYDGTAWDPSFLTCVPDGVNLGTEGGDISMPECFYVKHAPAPSLVVRTQALQKSGPFDPVYGSYFEDYDLCRRIKKLGYEVGFCQSARINHFSGSSTTNRARELKRMRQIIRNRVIFQIRDTEESRILLALRFGLLDFPRRLLRGILRTPSSQPPFVVLKAYIDLAKIIGRVVSRRRDEAIWQRYLKDIGWLGNSTKRLVSK